MVALITGHRGFLGSRIVSRLAEDGWDVAGAGRPDVEIPSPAFEALVREMQPELVVHCAGPASVPASVEDPVRDRSGSVDVLAAVLAQLGDARLVLLSSAAVYGDPAALPVREDVALAPVSPYGRHRVESEALALASGAPVTIARVFSAYGEGLRRQVLWDISRKALAGGPIDLAGTGLESRDFVHASDVAAAVSLIAARGEFAGEQFNVASGAETRISELAAMLTGALGVEADVCFTGSPRIGDPLRWRADISRLKALGFVPSIALDEGVAAYASWVRDDR